MHSGALLRVVTTPYCQAVMLESWDAPPGRFFVDYRARHGYTAVIGNGVIDEFRTISGPILIAPAKIIGGVYDAGMLLADERDVELPIDQGWPPLTIGVAVAAPAMQDGWEAGLLAVMQGAHNSDEFGLWQSRLRATGDDKVKVEVLQCALGGRPVATVIVTNASLLPQQLGCLVDTDDADMTVAVATGNRLPRVAGGEMHAVDVVGESTLRSITQQLRALFRE